MRLQSQLDCSDDIFNHAYQRVLRDWWERWQEHLNKKEPHHTLYVAPLPERAYQSFSAQQLLEWYVRNVDDVESGIRPTSEDRQLLQSISGWNDKQIDALFRRAHNQLVPRVTQAARGHVRPHCISYDAILIEVNRKTSRLELLSSSKIISVALSLRNER